jgi:hypothetical protein
MGDAIGQVLSFAVAAGLSPIPIIGVVLMLGTPRARVNATAFVLGWVNVLKLALGVLLLVVALRQWRGRPKEGERPKTPKWMATVDSFTAARSAALAVALAAINPKNLILVVGAAAAIAQTGASTGDQVVPCSSSRRSPPLGVGLPSGFA